MIQIEVTEREMWTIRYALKVLADDIPKPNVSEPGEKVLADEARELYQKLHN
jgi:hypothetical protein